jgi:hypothetical protein
MMQSDMPMRKQLTNLTHSAKLVHCSAEIRLPNVIALSHENHT